LNQVKKLRLAPRRPEKKGLRQPSWARSSGLRGVHGGAQSSSLR